MDEFQQIDFNSVIFLLNKYHLRPIHLKRKKIGYSQMIKLTLKFNPSIDNKDYIWDMG